MNQPRRPAFLDDRRLRRVAGLIATVALLLLVVPGTFKRSKELPTHYIDEFRPLDVQAPELKLIEPENTIEVPRDQLERLIEKDLPAAPPPARKNAVILNPMGEITGWTLRVGAFEDKTNAEGLIDRLRARGYNPYKRLIQPKGERLWLVLVGPYLIYEEAERGSASLKKDAQALQLGSDWTARIVEYRP